MYAMGVTWEQFWRLNPRECRYIENGYTERMKHEDAVAWLHGKYVFDAVSIVVHNALGGKGVKPIEYPSKPYSIEKEESERPLSEEEIQAQRELFMAQLNSMMDNFNAEHENTEV